MVTKKSITTEVFVIDMADLVEYCPSIAGLSPEDAEDYARRHYAEVARAVVEWGADQVWSEPEYSWTSIVESSNWELGGLSGELLVQLVMC